MRDSGCDLWNGTVEYTHAVLEEVRAQAVRGLTALSHGGLEIGGVLYGERRNGLTRILASAEFECEHALGPGFVLSENDAARFREMLKPRDDLRAVGWYCSHTRSSGLSLSPNDCSIFERFFSDGANVALLLKPAKSGPTEATFYLQGSAEPGPHFSILPPRAKPRVEVPPVQTEPVEPIEQAVPAPPPKVEVTPVVAPIATRKREITLPKFDLPRLRGAGVGLAAALLLMLSLTLLTGKKVESANPGLGLQAYPLMAHQIRIEWDRQSAAIRAAKSGTLEILEGGARRVVELNPEQMRTTSLTYESRTGVVDVRMKVSNGPEEAVRVVSTLPPVEAEPSSEPVKAANSQPVVERSVPAVQQVVERKPVEPVRLKRFEIGESDTVPPTVVASLNLPDPPLGGVPNLPIGLPKLSVPVTGAPAPPPVVKSKPGPRSGRLFWTGQLSRRGVVEIDGGTATIGSVIGALPGVPVSLKVMPAKFDHDVLMVYSTDAAQHNKSEAPGPSTGWNRVRFVWDPEEVKRISVLEWPRADNQFTRLALRNDGRPCDVIVVEWHVN